jgi:ABC-2 type transport system ATP-binding protein
MNQNSIVEVLNLKKKYRGSDEEALKGIDFSIIKGEKVGLLGPNSAGKTTLISILCGILKFNLGQVLVNGIDVKLFPKQIRSTIGLVPQEIALYPNLTINENLMFFGKMQGFSGKILKEKVNSLINILKLDQHRAKLVSKCSGGIKRRANLVAGLIHEPPLIFLDEPTLGVDPQSRNLIFDFIEQLNKQGATIIYTTHYMREAETLCNRVEIIDNGKVVASGTPAELIKIHDGCSDLGQVFLKITGKDLRE